MHIKSAHMSSLSYMIIYYQHAINDHANATKVHSTLQI
jgi:hypothetical protein